MALVELEGSGRSLALNRLLFEVKTFGRKRHAFTTFPERHSPSIFTTLSSPSTADMSTRYFVSKLLEILVVREMAARLTLSSSQPTITINTLNPGFCRSSLGRDVPGWSLPLTLYFWGLVLGRSAEVGSRTIVAAAEAGGNGAQGKYISEGGVESEFVRSEEEREVQGRVWGELVVKLEAVREGVTGYLV
ncbi:MAG: hypothetical protein Q9185_001374 [Variospora sp. 1 TL-2023]